MNKTDFVYELIKNAHKVGGYDLRLEVSHCCVITLGSENNQWIPFAKEGYTGLKLFGVPMYMTERCGIRIRFKVSAR